MTGDGRRARFWESEQIDIRRVAAHGPRQQPIHCRERYSKIEVTSFKSTTTKKTNRNRIKEEEREKEKEREMSRS